MYFIFTIIHNKKKKERKDNTRRVPSSQARAPFLVPAAVFAPHARRSATAALAVRSSGSASHAVGAAVKVGAAVMVGAAVVVGAAVNVGASDKSASPSSGAAITVGAAAVGAVVVVVVGAGDEKAATKVRRGDVGGASMTNPIVREKNIKKRHHSQVATSFDKSCMEKEENKRHRS